MTSRLKHRISLSCMVLLWLPVFTLLSTVNIPQCKLQTSKCSVKLLNDHVLNNLPKEALQLLAIYNWLKTSQQSDQTGGAFFTYRVKVQLTDGS